MDAWLIGGLAALVVVLGAVMVRLPYGLREPARFEAAGRLAQGLRRGWAGLVRTWRVLNRYPELGGYVHDTAMTAWIHFTQCAYSAGTWTATVASNVWFNRRSAADAAFTVQIPVLLPSNGGTNKGSYLKSVEVHYRVGTAALDAAAAALYKATLGADGSLLTVASVTTSYDAGHDTAGERIDQDEHKLTLTLSAPAWIDDGEYYFVELVVDAAATSVFDLFGAAANYTLRL